MEKILTKHQIDEILADIVVAGGDYADPECVYRRILAEKEKCHGLGHPEVARTAASLALVLFYMNLKIESVNTCSRDFWEKITTYQHYWNFARLNSYKLNRAPVQILEEADPRLSSKILIFGPINLEALLDQNLGKVYHDVPVLPAGFDDTPFTPGRF